MNRFLPLLLALPLAACMGAGDDRGLVSQHQPVVAQDGTARVTSCPNWTTKTQDNTEGNAPNYGCATAINLAAMLADPADLIRGRGSDSGTAAEHSTRAIKAWREVAPTSKSWTVTTAVSTKGGN